MVTHSRLSLIWIVTLMAVVLLPAVAVSRPARAQTDTTAAWRADLAFLADELPRRHVNAFHAVDQADFEAAVADLDAAIPALSYEEFVVRLMQIVALVGDSHTALAWTTMGDYAVFPLQMAVYPDAVYLVAADRPYAAGVRGQVIAIDDTPVETIRERLSTVVSHENDQWLRRQTGSLLSVADILYGLGILAARDQGAFTFQTETGETVTQTVTAIRQSQFQAAPLDYVVATENVTDPPVPWYYSRVYYGFERVAGDALYVVYNRCASDPQYPVDQFIADVLAEIDGGGVTRVIIDLRRNTGGDSRLLEPLIAALQTREVVNQPGHLTVLIGPDVYSSAVLNAVQLQQRTAALLVGEPAGQPPNHYGEAKTFDLPNTGLTVAYSTKYFVFVEDDVPALEPDIPVNSTAQDLFSGRDPVLEAALTVQ